MNFRIDTKVLLALIDLKNLKTLAQHIFCQYYYLFIHLFDWLLLFYFHFDGLYKGCDLEQKNSAIRQQTAVLRANPIESITSDFKMGVINCNINPYLLQVSRITK